MFYVKVAIQMALLHANLCADAYCHFEWWESLKHLFAVFKWQGKASKPGDPFCKPEEMSVFYIKDLKWLQKSWNFRFLSKDSFRPALLRTKALLLQCGRPDPWKRFFFRLILDGPMMNPGFFWKYCWFVKLFSCNTQSHRDSMYFI